ncbi:hypothetical protein MVEN_00504300 [Mycena venus]|uniref:Phosphatidate phosphatase APP1 catalytic domain-containing protein n=1 Tax=Mycena venus TaxID=2733690 RepID=A0A8H6YNR2_9AGAR|nr:hypothetical protein MVEN_00504300 [Mycena venus]
MSRRVFLSGRVLRSLTHTRGRRKSYRPRRSFLRGPRWHPLPPPRPPTPPPPKYRHWDRVIKDFLAKLSLKQAVTGFEADVLVMNPDFERANVPSALSELLQGIILIQQGVDVPEPDRPLEERKLDYVHAPNPTSHTSINKSISAFLAQNRAKNDASNRAEFLHSLAEKKRKRADNDDGADISSCARTDAKTIDRDVQMKYDIAKNSDGPLRRTTRQKAKATAAVDAAPAAPPTTTSTSTRTKTKSAAAARDKDKDKDKKAESPVVMKPETDAKQVHFGLDQRLDNIETHFSVRYVPSQPDSFLARLQFLEEHIIRLEKDYPPWAALHFNQPNRGWPPPPRATPIIVPPHLRSTVSSTAAALVPPKVLPGGAKTKNTGSSLQRAVMDQLAMKEARSDLAGHENYQILCLWTWKYSRPTRRSKTYMAWKPTLSNIQSGSSSRLSAVKGYISQRDFKTDLKNIPNALQRGTTPDGTKQTWKEWAGQKISAVNTMRGQGANSQNSERIALFPGWAARRYRQDGVGRTQEAFDVDLFVSGFASSHRPAELASRSQKAFLKLAKEDLLADIKLPPRPTEITEDFEVEALERQFQRINRSDSASQSSIDDSEPDDASPIVTSSSASSQFQFPNDVRRLHRNLETRIQPFWSSVLPSRTVRLNLFVSPLKGDDKSPRHNSVEEKDALEHGPVASRVVTTTIDGSFQARIRVTWEELCHHPGALHIAFGDPAVEHELLVTAALLPAPSSASASASASSQRLPPNPVETKTLHITLTNCPVRVLSDIDDTVKLANVVHGARKVFHNVFVKEFKEISNGPFELLPVLADFFVVSQLPPGSIKLRSYAGRSLFSGLLSAPATRKRAGVQEILHAFPESRFFLIGDSGEQDLELYAEFARERPDQILAVFIRDVDEFGELLEDPTGWKAIGASSSHLNGELWPRQSWSTTASSTPTTPAAYSLPPAHKDKDYFQPPNAPMTAEPDPIVEMTPTPQLTPRPTSLNAFRATTPTPSIRSAASTSTAGSSTKSSTKERMSETERKRYELQLRVWRARTQMPGHVPLRIFRDPRECVEAEEILKREKL